MSETEALHRLSYRKSSFRRDISLYPASLEKVLRLAVQILAYGIDHFQIGTTGNDKVIEFALKETGRKIVDGDVRALECFIQSNTNDICLVVPGKGLRPEFKIDLNLYLGKCPILADQNISAEFADVWQAVLDVPSLAPAHKGTSIHNQMIAFPQSELPSFHKEVWYEKQKFCEEAAAKYAFYMVHIKPAFCRRTFVEKEVDLDQLASRRDLPLVHAKTRLVTIALFNHYVMTGRFPLREQWVITNDKTVVDAEHGVKQDYQILVGFYDEDGLKIWDWSVERYFREQSDNVGLAVALQY